MTFPRANILSTLLLGFYLLFVFTSGLSISVAQVALEGSLALFLIICVTERYNPFTRNLRWLYGSIGLLILWEIVASLFSPTPGHSLLLSREEWLFTAVPVGIYLGRTERYRRLLVSVLAVTVLILLPIGLIQYITGTDMFTAGPLRPAPHFGYRVGGWFGDVTFGNYMSVVTIVLAVLVVTGKRWFPRWQWRLLLTAAIAGIVLTLLTFQRSPQAALVLSFVVLFTLVRERRQKLIGLISVVALLFVLLGLGLGSRIISESGRELEGAVRSSRLFIWRHTLSIIAEHPLTGVGNGHFEENYRAHLPPELPPTAAVSTAHNDYLNMAAVYGLPGAVIFIFMWGTFLLILFRHYRRLRQQPENPQTIWLIAAICGTACFLVASMFHAAFTDDEVRQLLMLVWALGLSALPENSAPEQGKLNT